MPPLTPTHTEQKTESAAQCILLILIIDYLLFPGSGNILDFLFSINIWTYDSFCFVLSNESCVFKLQHVQTFGIH